MGVDSGLPDFRGNTGFWKAYPPLAKLGIQFEEMANPEWFTTNPWLAWGFYGHRLNLYRKTSPHTGFQILFEKYWNQNTPIFIFTSNVDGHFQKAGFIKDQIMECHGSLLRLQCLNQCGHPIWEVDSDVELQFNPLTLLAEDPLPRCPRCGALARPNILMFSDWGWDQKRTSNQHEYFQAWLEQHKKTDLLVLELGAGTNIPTVRTTCEEVFETIGNHFVRINPREAESKIDNVISIPMKAMKALELINQSE